MRYKLFDLIKQVDERNSSEKYGISDVKGISIQKIFIETKAKMDGVNLKPYKLVKPNTFAYVTVTSRNGEKITLAYNDSENTYIVSSSYIVFNVKRQDLLIPEFLFMYFNRPEFDRFSRYNSWGSARETFSWDDMCDIEIDLPPLHIQEKYVEIYKAMLANQKAYENGLEDLKLVCDATIEKLRREMPNETIRPYISRIDERNLDNIIKNVKGVSVTKQFRTPTSKVNIDKLSDYKIVRPRQITFVQTTHNEKVFAYAVNNTNEDIVVTSVNEVFETNKESLLPEFLAQFFSRQEFDRYARFHSWGSARETFTWEDVCQVKIPIPDIHIQQSIVDIYNAYITRKQINERLKQQIKDICPILIAGAIKEANANA
jgi:hypothetical protein